MQNHPGSMYVIIFQIYGAMARISKIVAAVLKRVKQLLHIAQP